MKKVAVIGANSYIARNLLKIIDKAEYDLTLYDVGAEHTDHEANYRRLDLLDPASVQQLDLQTDYIYLFSGLTGTLSGFDEYGRFIDINEKGLLNVLTEYRKQTSKAKIIFPSTRLVYKGNPEPLREDAEKEFKSIYAINKYSCEQYLKMYHQMFGVNYVIYRICVPYGNLVEGGSYGTMSFFMNSIKNKGEIPIYGSGAQRKTFTHIEDICYIMLAGAENEQCANDVFNIGGEELSLREAAEKFAAKYGAAVKSVPWPEREFKLESGDTVLDSSKIDGILGYEYRHDFDSWLGAAAD